MTIGNIVHAVKLFFNITLYSKTMIKYCNRKN